MTANKSQCLFNTKKEGEKVEDKEQNAEINKFSSQRGKRSGI